MGFCHEGLYSTNRPTLFLDSEAQEKALQKERVSELSRSAERDEGSAPRPCHLLKKVDENFPNKSVRTTRENIPIVCAKIERRADAYMKNRFLSSLCVLFALATLLNSAPRAFAVSGFDAESSSAPVGYATWSVELFTVGCGYLVHPVKMPIYKGESSACGLIRLLSENGFAAYYSGTASDSFYLAYIADGDMPSDKFGRYTKSDTPQSAGKLSLSPSLPAFLVPLIKDSVTFFDEDDYVKNWTGCIGEFVFTNGSGWMYCVNNVFPGVSLSDTFLKDGDVVRVQFTLAYGADIGGAGSVGAAIPGVGGGPVPGYYKTANKDRLTEALARAASSGLTSESIVKDAYSGALSAAVLPNASQSAVDGAEKALCEALSAAERLGEFGEPGNSDSAEKPSSGGVKGEHESAESGSAEKGKNETEAAAGDISIGAQAHGKEDMTSDGAGGLGAPDTESGENESDSIGEESKKDSAESNGANTSSADIVADKGDKSDKSEKEKADTGTAEKEHGGNIKTVVLLSSAFLLISAVGVFQVFKRKAARKGENKKENEENKEKSENESDGGE